MSAEGSRPGSARERRREARKSNWGVTLGVIVIGLAVIVAGWAIVGPKPTKKGTEIVSIKPKRPAAAKKPVTAQRTMVVLAVEEIESQKRVKGALPVVFDPARNLVGGLIVDANTYVSVPGRGFQSILDGYSEGPKSLAIAIADMVGVEAEGYLIVAGDKFAAMIEQKDVAGFFNSFTEASIDKSEAQKLADRIGGIPKDRVTLSPLPVKSIVIGEQTYFEANRDDLKRLVKAVWGREPEQPKVESRVIILNGNGAPGVGRVAADRLIGKGYKILDVKNADNFNYTRTEVLLYNRRGKQVGAKLVKALGVGRLIDRPMMQNVTDAVVVIGKDFH